MVRGEFRGEVEEIGHAAPHGQERTLLLPDVREVSHAVAHARVLRQLVQPLAQEHLVARVCHGAAD